MWEYFINRNRFTYLLLLALIGAGFFALFSIPRESSPEVQIPIGIVTTVFPGASSLEIESLITDELERGLIGKLDHVRKITSTSRESVSTIVVEFTPEADLERSLRRLRDEVDNLKTELPSDAEGPFVAEVDFVDQPILTVAIATDAPPFILTETAKALEREIEALTGVSRVEISGVYEREISVLVDTGRLAQFELAVADVASAIRMADTASPIGQIESEGIIYNVAFSGRPRSDLDIANLPIGQQGGQPVFVRDIAEVSYELAPPHTGSRLSLTGQPAQTAVAFSVYKQSGGDITRIAERVQTKLTELQTEGNLLHDYSVLTILDAGADIKRDLTQLSLTGLFTVSLVMLILVFALGWREALVTGLAIPLSFLIGFVGLYLSGNTINFLSLFSLILGIGILVDSGIVMVEGINRHMKDDPTIDKQQAARLAVREFAAPLIAGTLTTVSMFLGLFVVGGVIGEFIKSIPFTLVSVLFAAMFVALAILPVIAASFLRRRSQTTLEQKQVLYAHKLEDWYRCQISKIIGLKAREQRFLWLVRGLLILALLLPVSGLVKVVFFEQSDIDFIFVDVELPEGSSRDQTDLAMRRVEEVLYRSPDIESFLTTLGSPNLFSGGGQNERFANAFINLRADRSRTSSEIVEILRQELNPIDDVKVVVSQPSEGPPVGSPIGITLSGDDLATLQREAEKVAESLNNIAGTTNVRSGSENAIELVLNFDINRAALFGLNTASVTNTLRAAILGLEATTLTEGNEEVPVIVRLNVDNSLTPVASGTTRLDNVESLEMLNLRGLTGQTVPVSSVAELALRPTPSSINHEDGKRMVTVSGDVTDPQLTRDIQSEIMSQLDQNRLRSMGITVKSGGETEEADQAFKEMFLALVVGVVMMIAVLVIQFNSYRHTRYVLSILPYSLIGILFGLALTGNTLSFPSIMGFIALSGIVVNNSILLIDRMNRQRQEFPDRPIREIVIDSAAKRLRPILLTTLTTVIGLIPLIYAGDLWAPLAYAIIFGLLFSVVITLILVPVLYNRKPGDLSADRTTNNQLQA